MSCNRKCRSGSIFPLILGLLFLSYIGYNEANRPNLDLMKIDIAYNKANLLELADTVRENEEKINHLEVTHAQFEADFSAHETLNLEAQQAFRDLLVIVNNDIATLRSDLEDHALLNLAAQQRFQEALGLTNSDLEVLRASLRVLTFEFRDHKHDQYADKDHSHEMPEHQHDLPEHQHEMQEHSHEHTHPEHSHEHEHPEHSHEHSHDPIKIKLKWVIIDHCYVLQYLDENGEWQSVHKPKGE